MALDVYFVSGSPFAWRVLLALSVKGLDYNTHRLDVSKGDLRTPEYLALNPHGKVPVLQDGDLTIYESVAILAYLEKQYPDVPLFGETAEGYALTWQRLMELDTILTPLVRGIARPIFTGNVDGQEGAINELIAALNTELERYSSWLEQGDYLAGERITAADVALYPALALLTRVAPMAPDTLNIDFVPLAETYPELAAWMARIEAAEGFDKAYPPHWKEAKAA